MTVLSLVLFYMPIFREPDSHVSFVDMLFMAISTVSVTGLSTFDINSVFNDNGIILLEILFQVGGLGIMMISTAFVIFSKRRITLKQRQLIMTDMNQPRLSGIVRLIRITFAILIWFQLLFGTFFSIYFYYRGYFDRWRDAVFYGFYQAISAVTNSGFDVTGDSIKPFAHDYFLDPDHVFDFCRRNWFSCIDGVPGMAIIQTFQCEASVSFFLVYQISCVSFCYLVCFGNCLDLSIGKGPFIPRFQYECQMDQFDVLFDYDS